MFQKTRGFRRLYALELSLLTLVLICAMVATVAIIRPEAAGAFGPFAAAAGSIGLMLALYYGGDAYAKAKAALAGIAPPDKE